MNPKVIEVVGGIIRRRTSVDAVPGKEEFLIPLLARGIKALKIKLKGK